MLLRSPGGHPYMIIMISPFVASLTITTNLLPCSLYSHARTTLTTMVFNNVLVCRLVMEQRIFRTVSTLAIYAPARGLEGLLIPLFPLSNIHLPITEPWSLCAVRNHIVLWILSQMKITRLRSRCCGLALFFLTHLRSLKISSQYILPCPYLYDHILRYVLDIIYLLFC
jgi:hypothetical protein